MIEHRCDDPGKLPDEFPINASRILRLVTGRIDPVVDDQQLQHTILTEVGDCLICLRVMVLYATGIVADCFNRLDSGTQWLPELDVQLQAALDRIPKGEHG